MQCVAVCCSVLYMNEWRTLSTHPNNHPSLSESKRDLHKRDQHKKRPAQKVTYTEGTYFDDVHTHYNTLTLQHTITHYNTLHHTVKQCVLVFYNVLQCVIVWKHNHPDRKSVLQCVAVCCSVSKKRPTHAFNESFLLLTMRLGFNKHTLLIREPKL